MAQLYQMQHYNLQLEGGRRMGPTGAAEAGADAGGLMEGYLEQIITRKSWNQFFRWFLRLLERYILYLSKGTYNNTS